MSSDNQVSIVGNLNADPELRYAAGTPGLAVRRVFALPLISLELLRLDRRASAMRLAGLPATRRPRLSCGRAPS